MFGDGEAKSLISLSKLPAVQLSTSLCRCFRSVSLMGCTDINPSPLSFDPLFNKVCHILIHMGKNNYKLVAPQPAGIAEIAERFHQGIRKSDQNLIPHNMSVFVIDLFEIVPNAQGVPECWYDFPASYAEMCESKIRQTHLSF